MHLSEEPIASYYTEFISQEPFSGEADAGAIQTTDEYIYLFATTGYENFNDDEPTYFDLDSHILKIDKSSLQMIDSVSSVKRDPDKHDTVLLEGLVKELKPIETQLYSLEKSNDLSNLFDEWKLRPIEEKQNRPSQIEEIKKIMAKIL